MSKKRKELLDEDAWLQRETLQEEVTARRKAAARGRELVEQQQKKKDMRGGTR